MYVCTHVFMYVCTHVCTYVRMYLCMYVRMYVCMYVCMYVGTHYVCMYVCMYALCVYVYLYVCTQYVCAHVYMYVLCMYACMYIYVYHNLFHFWISVFCVFFPLFMLRPSCYQQDNFPNEDCAILQNIRRRPRDCYILIKGASDPQHVPNILYSFQPFELSIRIDNTILSTFP